MTPLEYERMRFDSMSRRQLTTRLGRITKTDKLMNYARMAYEFKYFDLSRSALRRLEEMGVELRTNWAREVQGKNPPPKPEIEVTKPIEREVTRKKRERKERPPKKEVVLDESDEIFGAFPIM